MALSWYEYPQARRWQCRPPDPAAFAFHAAWEGYVATPLVEAPSLADELGVRQVLIKDESNRLGTAAFKILGASWAVFRAISGRMAGDLPSSFAELAERIHPLSPIELVAATDGNHGWAVARVSRLLGLACRVFVPEGIETSVKESIESERARVTVVADTYDETVRRAAATAQRAGADAILVQDTAWHGYTEIPEWVVEGYVTMFTEIDNDADRSLDKGGLVVVPVGVGSLLQAALAHYRSGPSDVRRPALLSVEPDTAACVLASLTAGELKTVRTGDTVMAGLNCGTPSSLAWPYIRQGLDGAVAVTDSDASQAVEDLSTVGILTRPTGAASLAGARAVLTGDGSEARRGALGVGGASTVVLLCTEGAPEKAGVD